jgi:hypothetical protein
MALRASVARSGASTTGRASGAAREHPIHQRGILERAEVARVVGGSVAPHVAVPKQLRS